MSDLATGTFNVNLLPQENPAGHEAIGRLLIDKQFHGDLTASSKGQMLSFRTAVDGSAGYVAMEQVTGSLHGRSGTFVLQHSGSMDRGSATLALTVVPDSATGDLTGLTGAMQIHIADGQHSYTFSYTLPL